MLSGLVELHEDAVVLGPGEDAHQVVARVPSPVLDDLGDVGHVLRVGLSCPGDDLGIVEPALGADHVIGPAMEGVVVLGLDTHHECDET